MKSNFGTMTHTEKRLNKEGLHHYKQGDPHEIKYMIPGLADNSQGIGGTMPIRGKEHMDRGRNKNQLRMSHDFSRAGIELTQAP